MIVIPTVSRHVKSYLGRYVSVKMLFLVAGVVAMLMISPLLTAVAKAQDTGTVMVSPTTAHVELSRGTVLSESMKITNAGDSVISVKVYAAPYSVRNDEYEPQFEQATRRNDIVQWITFDRTELTLQAGESYEVEFTITVPDSIPAGGQYAAIFAQTTEVKGEGVNLTARAGMLLYARTDGKTVEETAYVRSRFPFWLHLGGNVGTTATFKNRGNVDSVVSGALKVRNQMTGETVFSGTAVEKILLPDTSRELHLDWDKNLPAAGVFELTQELTVQDQIIRQRSVIVVLPIWLIIACIAFVVMMAIAVSAWIRSRKHHAQVHRVGRNRHARKRQDRDEHSNSIMDTGSDMESETTRFFETFQD